MTTTPESRYTKAAQKADWEQVASNGGPSCFHLEDGKFCLRAERWAGHEHFHKHVPLEQLLVNASASLQARVDQLERDVAAWRAVGAETPHALEVVLDAVKESFAREERKNADLKRQLAEAIASREIEYNTQIVPDGMEISAYDEECGAYVGKYRGSMSQAETIHQTVQATLEAYSLQQEVTVERLEQQVKQLTQERANLIQKVERCTAHELTLSVRLNESKREAETLRASLRSIDKYEIEGSGWTQDIANIKRIARTALAGGDSSPAEPETKA
jgi:predicted RNase H-like nuclease (RuvC/YqgF family)